MQWVFLAIAIAFEVGGTLSLRVASTGRRAFYAVVALGYGLSFVFLSLALGEGLGIGVAYGIWAACGVALIALGLNGSLQRTHHRAHGRGHVSRSRRRHHRGARHASLTARAPVTAQRCRRSSPGLIHTHG